MKNGNPLRYTIAIPDVKKKKRQAGRALDKMKNFKNLKV